MKKRRDTNRLRVLRAEKRISQMDVAERAHMGHNRLWKIENGYVQPDDDERAAIAKALGVPVSDVFPPASAGASA